MNWFRATRLHALTVFVSATAGQSSNVSRPEIEKWNILLKDPAKEGTQQLQHPEIRYLTTSTTPESFQRSFYDNTITIFDEADDVSDDVWTCASATACVNGGVIVALGKQFSKHGRLQSVASAGWEGMRIDTRTCRRIDQRVIAAWMDAYGEDSDFFRVRVMGLGPRFNEGKRADVVVSPA